jgi:hypothetical protein
LPNPSYDVTIDLFWAFCFGQADNPIKKRPICISMTNARLHQAMPATRHIHRQPTVAICHPIQKH